MRANATIVAVLLVGVSVSAQITAEDPIEGLSPFDHGQHRQAGLDTRIAQARHEHDVAVDQERLLAAAVQVFSDGGYGVTRVDEADATVTTDWVYLTRYPTPAQDRFIVSLDDDRKTLRVDLQTRSRDSGLDKFPGASKDKAETVLALIVKAMEEGRQPHPGLYHGADPAGRIRRP